MARRKKSRTARASCMRSKLKGKHYRSRRAQRAAFKRAAKACAGKRRHHRRRR